MSPFFYLVAVMDWATRHVLSWRLSNTIDSTFCIEALDAALHFGVPEIFNTDQGAQFTGIAFTDRVRACGARCSMDGRGRYLDNIFIERPRRSLRYEAVYLHERADGTAAERLVGSRFAFYNELRPHSSLHGRTPATSTGAPWERPHDRNPGHPRRERLDDAVDIVRSGPQIPFIEGNNSVGVHLISAFGLSNEPGPPHSTMAARPVVDTIGPAHAAML